MGEFATYEEALIAARKLVEDFFSDAEPGQSAEELYDGYTGFGDDPFIVAFGGADEPAHMFSAWDYAKHLAGGMEKVPGVPPRMSLPLRKDDPMSSNNRLGKTDKSQGKQDLQEEK